MQGVGRNPAIGDELIIAQRTTSTLRHNILRGSAKSPTSTGETVLFEIEKGLQHNTWRRISSLNSHLCCLCSCRAAAMGSSPFSSLSLHSLAHIHVYSLSHFALNFGCLLIGKDGSNSSINGCTWVAPLVNGGCNHHVQQLQLSRVIYCPLIHKS